MNLNEKEKKVLEEALRMYFDSYLVNVHEIVSISEKAALSSDFQNELKSDIEFENYDYEN